MPRSAALAFDTTGTIHSSVSDHQLGQAADVRVGIHGRAVTQVGHWCADRSRGCGRATDRCPRVRAGSGSTSRTAACPRRRRGRPPAHGAPQGPIASTTPTPPCPWMSAMSLVPKAGAHRRSRAWRPARARPPCLSAALPGCPARRRRSSNRGSSLLCARPPDAPRSDAAGRPAGSCGASRCRVRSRPGTLRPVTTAGPWPKASWAGATSAPAAARGRALLQQSAARDPVGGCRHGTECYTRRLRGVRGDAASPPGPRTQRGAVSVRPYPSCPARPSRDGRLRAVRPQ